MGGYGGHGPLFGYYVNAVKSWLLVKTAALRSDHCLRRHRPEHHDKLCAAPWGPRLETPRSQSRSLRNESTSGKKSLFDWLISPLSNHTWPADNTSESLRLLEDVLQKTVLPSLTGHASPGPEIRSLFGLPARLGGLGSGTPRKGLGAT